MSNELMFYIRLINREVDKKLNDKLKEYDLTKSQQEILGFIHHCPKEYIIQKDIEEHFHISNPTVTGILNRLEQKGFITRECCKNDKRIKIIRLTSKEQQLHEKIMYLHKQFDVSFSKLLTPEEKQEFLRLLQKVSEHIEEVDLC